MASNYFQWLGEKFKTIGNTTGGHAVQVSLTDCMGNPIIADPTGSLSTVTEPQNAVHSGDAYSFDLDGSVPATSSLYLMGATGSKQIHFDLFLANLQKGGIRLWLYEAPTTTANGTAQTPINMNFNSTKTSTLSLFLSPTITANGTKKVSEFFPLTGTGVNVSPATGEIAGGRVLKPNTKYLFRIENIDNSSCLFGIVFEWHDSDYIL